MPVDSISREELANSTHKEYNDSALMELASRILDVSVYQLLRSAMLMCNGHLYETHLDAAFSELMMGTGRIKSEYRQYIIDVLVGTNIFITDPANGDTEAVLLA